MNVLRSVRARLLTVLLPDHIGTDHASTPILHASASQGHANQDNGNGRDEGRKDALNPLYGHDGKEGLQQATNHDRSKHPVQNREGLIISLVLRITHTC